MGSSPLPITLNQLPSEQGASAHSPPCTELWEPGAYSSAQDGGRSCFIHLSSLRKADILIFIFFIHVYSVWTLEKN